MDKKHFNTRAIYAGQEPDPSTHAIVTPIYATSTYKQSAPDTQQEYVYSRTHNPTRLAYEQCIADLESGTKGFAFASGMAAINTVLDLFDNGAHIISSNDLYGGTIRLFDRVRTKTSNLHCSYVDMENIKNIENAITNETQMIFVETPTNPLLKLTNLNKIAQLGKQKGIITVADNTFASPWVQRPLEHGFDIVLHSATKYLNGHADVINGVVVVGDNPELADKLAFLQNSCGAIASPFDSFLVLRSLKTLPLRMERQCANAAEIAHWLAKHPKVKHVNYPGLETHPNHHLVSQQMHNQGGAMISFYIEDDINLVKRCLARCELFTLAESLGGVESLIEHPALMTHASVPQETRAALGISDGFIRLSIGIEHIDDLKADLNTALT